MFKGVINKVIERNTLEAQLKLSDAELQEANDQIHILEDISAVKDSKILMYEVMLKAAQRPWWDKFWIGTLAVALLTGTILILK